MARCARTDRPARHGAQRRLARDRDRAGHRPDPVGRASPSTLPTGLQPREDRHQAVVALVATVLAFVRAGRSPNPVATACSLVGLTSCWRSCGDLSVRSASCDRVREWGHHDAATTAEPRPTRPSCCGTSASSRTSTARQVDPGRSHAAAHRRGGRACRAPVPRPMDIERERGITIRARPCGCRSRRPATTPARRTLNMTTARRLHLQAAAAGAARRSARRRRAGDRGPDLATSTWRWTPICTSSRCSTRSTCPAPSRTSTPRHRRHHRRRPGRRARSAKTGEGVEALLNLIVDEVPPRSATPTARPGADLRLGLRASTAAS